jgi:hypothetical protein
VCLLSSTRTHTHTHTHAHARTHTGAGAGAGEDGSCGATTQTDLRHWSKFPGFAALRPAVVQQGGRCGALARQPLIYMRWKERFFVDGAADCGLTIAGGCAANAARVGQEDWGAGRAAAAAGCMLGGGPQQRGHGLPEQSPASSRRLCRPLHAPPVTAMRARARCA